MGPVKGAQGVAWGPSCTVLALLVVTVKTIEKQPMHGPDVFFIFFFPFHTSVCCIARES